MLIVYILMIMIFWAKLIRGRVPWLGTEFVRGRDVQLPDNARNSVRTRRSGVVLGSFKNSEHDQEIPHSQTADKPMAS